MGTDYVSQYMPQDYSLDDPNQQMGINYVSQYMPQDYSLNDPSLQIGNPSNNATNQAGGINGQKTLSNLMGTGAQLAGNYFQNQNYQNQVNAYQNQLSNMRIASRNAMQGNYN